MQRKKQSFFKGAFILSVAALIVKLLGAIFKIPLANILGGDGMGYFSTAYDLYMPVYVISNAGLPVAIARILHVLKEIDSGIVVSSSFTDTYNKKYETSVNSNGSSASHVFVNYHDGQLDLDVQLKCGKRYVQYSFSSDYSNKTYPNVEIFNIDVY